MLSCSHPQSRAAFGESEAVIIYKSRNYVALDDLNSQFQNFNNDCILFLLLLPWHLVSKVINFCFTRISIQSFHKSQTWLTDSLVHGSNFNHSEQMSFFDCCLTLWCISFMIRKAHCVTILNGDAMHPHAWDVYVRACMQALRHECWRVACQDPSSRSQTNTTTTPRAPVATFGGLLFGSSQGPNA